MIPRSDDRITAPAGTPGQQAEGVLPRGPANNNENKGGEQREDAVAVDQISQGLKDRAAASGDRQQQPDGGGDRGGDGRHQQQQERPAGNPTPQEELRQLRDRVAAMENEQTAREATRQAEDAVDDVIRRYENIPPESRDLIRRFLPKTADKGILEREIRKFEDALGAILVRRMGNFGGATRDGGTSTHRWMEQQAALMPADPATLITEGLRRRQR